MTTTTEPRPMAWKFGEPLQCWIALYGNDAHEVSILEWHNFIRLHGLEYDADEAAYLRISDYEVQS